jgi:hypothetical protein
LDKGEKSGGKINNDKNGVERGFLFRNSRAVKTGVLWLKILNFE